MGDKKTLKFSSTNDTTSLQVFRAEIISLFVAIVLFLLFDLIAATKESAPINMDRSSGVIATCRDITVYYWATSRQYN